MWLPSRKIIVWLPSRKMVVKNGCVLQVLVGNIPETEYVHIVKNEDGTSVTHTYIESKLKTPHSYEVPLTVVTALKEKEECKWPVTPYTIRVLNDSGFDAWATISVDGVQVTKELIKKGGNHIVRGFPDGDTIKEFLFSLPRFAESEDDRLKAARLGNVGDITCTLSRAMFSHTAKAKSSAAKGTDYTQCNKKDAKKITTQMVATTRMGREIEKKPYSVPGVEREMSYWNEGEQIAVLTLRYRMGHTLDDLGIRPAAP